MNPGASAHTSWRKAPSSTFPPLHRVTVSFPYAGSNGRAKRSFDLNVSAEKTVDLEYRSPWTVTNNGSLRVR